MTLDTPTRRVLLKTNWVAVSLIGLALTFIAVPRSRANDFSIKCFSDLNPMTSTTLPLREPCSGTSGGATYSGTGKIYEEPDGIVMGSDLSWNGSSPKGGFSLSATITGIVESATLKPGTPFVLKEYLAGEGTNGTGPYGGTYQYDFVPGSYYFDITYSTDLYVNGTKVLPLDSSTAVTPAICGPNTSFSCSGPASGNGTILHDPRVGSYQTIVGAQITVGWDYNNLFSWGVPTQGNFSYKLDPGLVFGANDPMTGAPISGLSLVLSDGTSIPLNGGVAPTSEPSSLVLLGGGLAGFIRVIRCKHRR